jgi:FtsZ-binding cell division protein ZapB
MKSYEALQKERARLHQEIADNLDFLQGSISTKGPKRPGFNLTFKINQVTRTRHIRKDHEAQVKQMTARWRRLRILLGKLSDTNWQLLHRGFGL